jgi:glycosyltransferase involved in cell wall biosynthesis
MQPISVVIIAKNEAHILAQTLQSIQTLTDDIIVCDTGSTDATIPVAKKNKASVIELSWRGYGATKNDANDRAAYDWILQLDADEVADAELLQSLTGLTLQDERTVYYAVLKNYYAGRYLRFGNWGNIQRIRLFNKQTAHWSTDDVHEKLIFDDTVQKQYLKGFIHHYTYHSIDEHERKIEEYTSLDAEKMFKRGIKPGFIKLYLAPKFTFLKNYVFRLGFLDGYYGLIAARLSSRHSYLKYKKLKDLYRQAARSK